MKSMNMKKYIFSMMALSVIGTFALVAPALANDTQGGNSINLGLENSVQVKGASGTVSAISGTTINDQGQNNQGQNNQGGNDSNKINPNVVGKVTAISGNIITISKQQESDKNISVTAIFTVDVTNAKIVRGETVIALSDIAVGDNIVAQGTMTGTNIVATLVRDGKVGNGNGNDNNQAFLQIQGNGQPLVAGKVSAINGLIITITNSSNITYTVNAAGAKIVQGKNVIFVADVKVGDSVLVQGNVNGSTVTASTIIDQNQSATAQSGSQGNGGGGFFGSIGQWFKHLFGF